MSVDGIGRPSDFTEETALAICTEIENGKTLRQIEKLEGFPSKTTIFRWLAANENFRDQYARSKQSQAEAMAEELLDIADDGTNDYEVRNNEDGSSTVVLNHDHINRSRLRVDTRKWLMSKMLPKKYGEKLDVEHGGAVSVRLLKADEAL